MKINEQEEMIVKLTDKFQEIAAENFIPITSRTVRMFAMVANTEYMKIIDSQPSQRS